MVAQAGAASEEAFGEDSGRHEEEEDDGGKDGVSADECVVLGDGGEAVSHAW